MKAGRIQKYYNCVVLEDFLILYNCRNIMQLPKIDQVSISTTSKKYVADKKELVNAFAAFFLYTGQKGILTRARKSIAGFKLREASPVGCMATMRRKQMYFFLDKVATFILPRLYNSSKERSNLNPGEKEKITTSSKKGVAKECVQPYTYGVYNSSFWPEAESLHELFEQTYGLHITVALSKSSTRNIAKNATKSKDSQKKGMLAFLSKEDALNPLFFAMQKNFGENTLFLQAKKKKEKRSIYEYENGESSLFTLKKEQLEKEKSRQQVCSKHIFDKEALSLYATQRKDKSLLHKNQGEMQRIFLSAFQYSC